MNPEIRDFSTDLVGVGDSKLMVNAILYVSS